jgi:exopolysaccharide biosynthesis polyprenyl glycosylphosphotransferase
MVDFAISGGRAHSAAALQYPVAPEAAGSHAEDEAARRTGTTAGSTRGLTWANGYRARLRATDAAIVTLAVAAAFAARFASAPGSIASPAGARLGAISLLVAAVWVASLSGCRSRDRRVVGVGAAEYKRVMQATTTTFGMLAIAFLVLGAHEAVVFFTLSFPAGFVALLLSRWLWRQWLTRQRAFGHSLSRVIVVGQRRDVEKVVEQISSGSSAAYAVVGAVVDERELRTTQRSLGETTVYPGLARVAEVARTLGVDGVVVAGQPRDDGDFIHDLAWDLEGGRAELILATSLANVAGPRIHFRPVDGLPLIHVEIPQFEGAKHLAKRAMDVVLASAALVLLSPVFALVALLVRADSDGGAIFSQERVGRGGRLFRIYKFRSMDSGAPQQLDALRSANEGSGALFKLREDPRITRIGRTLRKYSLDELPQLWNVLVGDMSLVGPRPPLPGEVSAYENHVHRRLFIKPGLTGMWQVNGRSNLSWEESVRLDLYYVENWSLLGDLILLWRTVRVVARPVGAY